MVRNILLGTVTAFCAAGIFASQALADNSQFDGVWHNGLKSEMTLKYDNKTDMLTGSYKNRATTSTPETSYPLVGHVNGDVISFTVNWSKPTPAGSSTYKTITAWVGQLVKAEDGKESIPTIWIYSQPTSNSPTCPVPLWRSINVNADTFERGPASK